MDGLVARAYIRVSTDEQAQSGFSLPAQRERLQSFAKSQGWTTAQVYEDEGYSAKDMKRPALQQLLKDARPGEVVLVYKLDRLTRSVIDLYELMKVIDQRGLLFKSATEEFNTTTSHGRLMITLVAVLAQWERETIAERVKMGRQKKATTGEWPGGPIPFGYRAEPSGKVRHGRNLMKLVPDPERAHIVREMFERYLAGQGARGLAIWLNEELRLASPNGGRWQATSVVRMLTNPVFAGEVVNGRRVPGPVTRVEGDHDPIVPPDLFTKVQHLFDMRKDMAPRHASGHYPLAGVAKCGACGGGISYLKNKWGHYYRCLRYVHGRGCGPRPLTSIPGPLAEEKVVELIDNLQHPPYLESYMQQCEALWAEKHGVTAQELKRLQSDLTEAENAIKRWDQAYESGRLELNEYLTRVQPHKERIVAVREQLEKTKETPILPDREVLASAVVEFGKVWKVAVPGERKVLLQRVIRAFGGTILLYPDQGVQVVPDV